MPVATVGKAEGVAVGTWVDVGSGGASVAVGVSIEDSVMVGLAGAVSSTD